MPASSKPIATAYVYLLHFHKRYPNGKQPGHYLGVTDDLKRRMREHRNGSTKSRLMKAVKEAGIQFELANVWEMESADQAFAKERQLKKQKKHHKYCPICCTSRNNT